MKENSKSDSFDISAVNIRLKKNAIDFFSHMDFLLESAIKNKKILYSFLFLLFAIALAIRVYTSSLIPIFREDALDYFHIAGQIAQGDFTPPLDLGIGLSIWESVFLLILGSGEVLHDISIVKILLAITGTILFIPIALISNKLFNKNVMIISLILFTFQPWLIANAAYAYSEPLFTLILLLIFYCLLKSIDHRYFLLLASVGLSFLYMTRINGIIVLPIILLYTILTYNDIPKFEKRYIIYMIVVFIIVLSPYLLMRWVEYGSISDYGVNSNIFAENREQTMSPNYEGQSLCQFLSTHSPLYIIKREIKGLIEVFNSVMSNMLIPTVGFAIIGFILTCKPRFSFIHITYITWILFFSWIFTIFPINRYFLPLIPLAIILAAFTIDKVSKETQYKYLTMVIILIFLISIAGGQLLDFNKNHNNKAELWEDGMEWAKWIAVNNETGQSIAIREGGDLIELFREDINIVAVPLCDTLTATMEILHEDDVDTLVIGNGGGETPDWERRPVLKDIYFSEHCPEYLELIHSNMDSDSTWKVQVYQINWNKFNE